MRPLALLFLLLPLAPEAQPAGADAAGRELVVAVLDADSRQLVEAAHVRVGESVGVTPPIGRVRFVGLASGEVRVVVSHVRYATADTTVALGDGRTRLTVRLERAVEALPTVTVTETSLNEGMLRRRGFFQRAATRTGVFMTRQELDERGAFSFSDAFVEVPGVRVERTSGTASLVSSRARGCPMAIFIDGVEAAFLAERVDSVPYGDIAAIEVYRGPAEVPVEYAYTRSRETCGAVLVWTQIAAGD